MKYKFFAILSALFIFSLGACGDADNSSDNNSEEKSSETANDTKTGGDTAKTGDDSLNFKDYGDKKVNELSGSDFCDLEDMQKKKLSEAKAFLCLSFTLSSVLTDMSGNKTSEQEIKDRCNKCLADPKSAEEFFESESSVSDSEGADPQPMSCAPVEKEEVCDGAEDLEDAKECKVKTNDFLAFVDKTIAEYKNVSCDDSMEKLQEINKKLEAEKAPFEKACPKLFSDDEDNDEGSSPEMPFFSTDSKEEAQGDCVAN